MWAEKRRRESPGRRWPPAGKAAPRAASPPGLAPSKLLESFISPTHPEGLGQWLVRFGEQGGGLLGDEPSASGAAWKRGVPTPTARGSKKPGRFPSLQPLVFGLPWPEGDGPARLGPPRAPLREEPCQLEGPLTHPSVPSQGPPPGQETGDDGRNRGTTRVPEP